MKRRNFTSNRKRRCAPCFLTIEAADNTEKIAEMCNFAFQFGTYHLPEFKLPPGETSGFEYLHKLCLEGLRKRYGEDWEKTLTA